MRADRTLLLIDLQLDYFPGGRHELPGAEAAVANAARLLAAAREAGAPIVHVQHLATSPSATFFIPGTEGIEFHPAVRPAVGETVIVKHRPNAFLGTELAAHLGEGRAVTVVGMMTSMCVDATVRAAADLGHTVSVAADACAAPELELRGRRVGAADVHTAFLAALDGTYAEVRTTAELLAEA